MHWIHLRKAYGETRLKTRNATPPPSPAARDYGATGRPGPATPLEDSKISVNSGTLW